MRASATALGGGLLALALLAEGLAGPALGAEDATVEAFSVWQGRGHLFQTDVDEATFVGAIVGVLYVQTERGPVAMGDMTCPATINLMLGDGTQLGNGRCMIVANDGARIFAEVECTGVHLVGCHGDFTVTGGDGRFAGIQGGGPITIRSDLAALAGTEVGSWEETTRGILYLPAIHYTIP